MGSTNIASRMKREMEQIYMQVGGFFSFVKESLYLQLVSVLVILLCYGTQIFSKGGYRDQQVVLANQGTEYNWNEIGRFSFVWLRKLFGTNNYNPYFTGVLFVAFFLLACLMWLYLFQKVTNKSMGMFGQFVFVILFVTHPILTEQYYFRFQSFEINFGLFLIPICLMLAFDWIRKRNRTSCFLSIIFTVFGFGIYQSMVPVYIAGGVIVILFWMLDSSQSGMDCWKAIGKLVGVFLVSLLIYGVMWKAFYYSSNYLDGQIGWGKNSILDNMYTILRYIYHVIKGKGYFFTVSYLVMCVLLFFVVIHAIGRGAILRGKRIVAVVTAIGVVVSPFLLVIVNGYYIMNRAQITLPITCAGGILFCIYYLKNYTTFKVITVFVGVSITFLSLSQLDNTMRILYTHDTIVKNDEIVVAQLTKDLNEEISNVGNKPVVFVGQLEPKTNAACINIEKDLSYSYLFDSAIQAEALMEPYSFVGTQSTIAYFKTLGICYEVPSVEQVERGVNESMTMQVWPGQDSIKNLDDIIVVKMSDR